ncbi:MAG: uncharacterized protein QOG03_1562 [Actinomycetota bacterium]|nr:uncharacterized protein [Actinomycetota bacterium]
MTADDLVAQFDTEQGIRQLRWAIFFLLALAFGACIATGADRPANPALVKASRVQGFGEVKVKVKAKTGSHNLCAMLADTLDQREKGLMGRHDLAGYDAMAFVFKASSDVPFVMRNTLIPLSIAWVDDKKKVVAVADMDPCAAEPCRTYSAGKAYRAAIEVKSGDLARFGVAPGTTVDVGGACDSG